MPRSEVMLDPWNDQTMVRGWSPFVTMHKTWAEAPESITSCPNERGSKFGGSKEKEVIYIYHKI